MIEPDGKDPARDFASLVAIVTGGASGIGLATAHALRRRGAQVVVFDKAAPAGSDIDHVPVDVTDSYGVEVAVNQVKDDHGRIDILINNAGIGARGPVTENDLSEWRKAFEVNVFSIVTMARATLAELRQSDAGAIVNVCSIAATVGLPDRALYSATKGAVYSLTLAMAADHVREGVRVNCVIPGTADTPWVQRLLDAAPDPAAERRALAERQPHGRLVSPAEVAEAICYLASPLSGSTIGTALNVDGGMESLRLRPQA